NTDANLPNKQITIRADKGVVTLSGTVASDAERNAAAADAGAIGGVKTVVNNLTVGETAVAAAAPAAPEQAAQTTPAASAPAAAPAARASARRKDAGWSRKPATQPTRSYGSLPKDTSTPSSSDVGTAPSYSQRSQPATSTYSAPAPAPAPVEPTPVTVPDGTVLNIRLIDGIDTSRSQPGEVFKATLDSPITIGDHIAIPADADVTGRVAELRQSGRFAG